MGLRYTTIKHIRATSGISSTFITDEDFELIGEDIEHRIETKLGTKFYPTFFVEHLAGNNLPAISLLKTPILKVVKLKIGDETIDPENIIIDENSGILYLSSDAELKVFTKNTPKNIFVAYYYGSLEKTAPTTTLTAQASAGTNATLSVSDASGFSVGDYVWLNSLEGVKEYAKITSKTGNDLVVDNLMATYDSGSYVMKMQISPTIRRLMTLGISLAGVAKIVGSSFDEITGYSIQGLNIQKGEPYTQWRETATQLRKEYDEIIKNIRPQIAIR